MDQVAFRLPVELKQRLVEFAAARKASLNTVLLDAVGIHLCSVSDRRLALAILDTPIFTGDLTTGFDEAQFLKTAGVRSPWTPSTELLASLAEFAQSAAVEPESTWGEVEPEFANALAAGVLDKRENELSMMRAIVVEFGSDKQGYRVGSMPADLGFRVYPDAQPVDVSDMEEAPAAWAEYSEKCGSRGEAGAEEWQDKLGGLDAKTRKTLGGIKPDQQATWLDLNGVEFK